MEGASVLNEIGYTLLIFDWVCSFVSLFHIAPQGSRLAGVHLGLFGRRQDFTKTGWRIVVVGQVLAVAGFLLLFASRWVEK